MKECKNQTECRSKPTVDHSKIEPHSCPYEEELHSDPSDDYCNCCEECRHACALEI